MIIYEKDNKLNINFENNVEEQADLQISKSGDKTEVLIDGQPGSGGSGGGVLICTDTDGTLDKTMGEIQEAINSGKIIYISIDNGLYVFQSLVIMYYPIRYIPKDQLYHGTIGIADEVTGFLQYDVGEATEEAALSAYPEQIVQ